jgi:hypothetical protein
MGLQDVEAAALAVQVHRFRLTLDLDQPDVAASGVGDV